MDAPGAVSVFRDIANVERGFRHVKVDDLSLRPIPHCLEAGVHAHMFICMLAPYLVWHLCEVLAPLTFTDEHPPTRDNPVTPAIRSASASKKAAAKRNGADEEVRGFCELLDHFATLTRNTVAVTTDKASTFELSRGIKFSSAARSRAETLRATAQANHLAPRSRRQVLVRGPVYGEGSNSISSDVRPLKWKCLLHSSSKSSLSRRFESAGRRI